MQGKVFEANVLLMLLRGCELILGIKWLNSMGVVKWDFPNRTMEFTLGEELILLRVDNDCQVLWKDGSLFNLQRGVRVWMIQQTNQQQQKR